MARASHDPRDQPSLDEAILVSLDGLLRALELEPAGDDRFRVVAEPDRFTRVFGGQTVAQALLAAGATVADKDPHSLHAYFVEAGVPTGALEVAVERVRDGRSMADAPQHRHPGRPDPPRGAGVVPRQPRRARAWPSPRRRSPAPDQLPVLQDWLRRPPTGARGATGPAWVDQPPPLELRIGEAPTFLGGPPPTSAARTGCACHATWATIRSSTPRCSRTRPTTSCSTWRCARTRSASAAGAFTAFSVDHALWFHRPVRFDRWHLHTQETISRLGSPGSGARLGARRGRRPRRQRHAGGARAPHYGDPAMTSFSHRMFEQAWPEGEYRHVPGRLRGRRAVVARRAVGARLRRRARSTSSPASRRRARTAAPRPPSTSRSRSRRPGRCRSS